MERAGLGPRSDPAPDRDQRRRERHQRQQRTRPRHHLLAGDAGGRRIRVPGNDVGAGQAASAGRRAPAERRPSPPGGRLRGSARAIGLLPPARGPGRDHAAADRRRPPPPLAATGGRGRQAADRHHPGDGGRRPDRRSRTGRKLVARRPPLGQLGPLRPQPVRRGDRRVGTTHARRAAAPGGIRTPGNDPRRDPPGRAGLHRGAGPVRRPRDGQPQQLPRARAGRSAVLRRADSPAGLARRRDRRSARRLDAAS